MADEIVTEIAEGTKVAHYPCHHRRAYVKPSNLVQFKVCPECGQKYRVQRSPVIEDGVSIIRWRVMVRALPSLSDVLEQAAAYSVNRRRLWTLSLTNIVDFYLLDAMSSALPNSALKRGVDAMLRHVTSLLAVMLRDYCYLSCMGEARHGVASNSHLMIKSLPQAGEGREQAIKHGLRYRPEDALPHLERLFRQGDWRSGFGGENWANIAAAGRMYGTVPDAVFVDHAVDLQHNNGCAFSKSSAFRVMGLKKPGLPDWFTHYLGFKANADVLGESTSYIARDQWSYAHPLTGMFAKRYYQSVGKKAPVSFVTPTHIPEIEYASPRWEGQKIEVGR